MEEDNVEINVDPSDFFNNSIISSVHNDNAEMFDVSSGEILSENIGSSDKQEEGISSSKENEASDGNVISYKVRNR
jgi:hypothetical protein